MLATLLEKDLLARRGKILIGEGPGAGQQGRKIGSRRAVPGEDGLVFIEGVIQKHSGICGICHGPFPGLTP